MISYYKLSHIFAAPEFREPNNYMPDIRLYSIILLLLFVLNPWSGSDISAQVDTIDISFVCVDGDPGETICVDVQVDGFIDATSIQFSFNFDPSVLRFLNVQNEVLLQGLAFSPGPTEVRYIWTDQTAMGVDLADGTTLLELCFEIVGTPGNSSVIDLTSNYDQEVGNSASEIFLLNTNPCTVNVNNPNAVAATIAQCGSPDGIQDGFFTITIFGGSEPYTYTWTGPVNGMSSIATSGESEIQILPIGSYDILVTDNMGETFMLSATIMNNAFVHSVAPFDPTCYNFTNGRIAVDAANGSAPYGVIWEHATDNQYFGSNFIFSSGGSVNLPSLPTGTYNITITDANGCSATESVILDVDDYFIDNIVITDATCNGSADGGVSFLVSGATPLPGGEYDLAFSWMGGVVRTDQYTTGSLNPGSYEITISDAVNQCDTVFAFTIEAQIEILASITTIDPLCPGSAEGEAEITGIPVGAYDFQRLDSLGNPDGPPIMGTASARFTGLEAGTYGVLISDAGCVSDTIWFVLTDPEPMTIDVINIDPQGCQFMDGSITVQAMGGFIGPGSDYVYSWNGGTLMGSMINNLSSGNYMLTVSDDNSCTAEATVFVSSATSPQIDSIVATNLSCIGAPITTVEVFYTDGSFPVTSINWSTGDMTAQITNQTAGDTLFVTINDDRLCFDASSAYIVPGGSEFILDSVRLESPTCPGDNDGQFTVFTSGGIEPLTYYWSTGDTTTFNLLPGLTAGPYSVTVVDNSSDTCGVITTEVNLNDIVSLEFFFTNIDSTGCSLICSGEATLIPSGGNIGMPYNFFWDGYPVETGAQSTKTDLCGGWQVVSISQDNFCFYTDSVFIPFPPGISIDIVTFDDVVCSGSDDGFISLSASGGAGGYQYSWQTLPPGPVQSDLGVGTYYVTVTDNDMCAAIDSFTVVPGEAVMILLDSTTFNPIGCAGGNDGVIGVQTIGGIPGYDYTWAPNVSNGPLAQMLGPGTYAITVTDQSGCTDSLSVILTEPEPIQTYLAQIIPPSCTGETTLVGIDSVTGGVGEHTWSINGGQQFSLDTLIPLAVGFYNIIVFDEGNCRDTTMIVIDGPLPIVLDIFPDEPTLELGDSILLDLDISNTQGPVDSIAWGNDDGLGNLSCNDCTMPYARNLLPTTYYVQVWDSAGCLSVTSVFVDVDNKRNVFIPNVFTPNQDGRNEEFKIFTGQGVIGIRSARIFNRWGDLMAEEINPPLTADGTFVWNGEFKGQLMTPGVYVYLAEVLFADAPNTPLIYRGDITLIR